MFCDEITTSDAFLDMPTGSQLLYFHLGMNADDDGFIANPKMVMRILGSNIDEYKVLIGKKFILTFDSGICVVKHWRINNYIRKDIYKETKYAKEKGLLYIRENGAYSLRPEGAVALPSGHFTVDKILENKGDNDDVDTTSTERLRNVHLGKVRIGKDSIDNTKGFKRPTVSEVESYCKERGNTIGAQVFIDYYESNGWKVGRNPMKDWKAAIRNWETMKRQKSGTQVLTTENSSKIINKMKDKIIKG